MKVASVNPGPPDPNGRSSGRRRFAFVVNADTPIASWSLLRSLRSEFPDHDVDVVNLSRELKRSPTGLASCAVEAALCYPRQILSRRKTLRNTIFRTASVERFVQKRLASIVHPGTHDFVLQIQSLWSAKVRGIPHFIYTDHTNLTNLQYPDPNPDAVYSQSFLRRETDMLRKATTVFTRSTNITRDIVGLYGVDPARVECVFAGANTETATLPEHSTPAHPLGGKTILFVGIDWERKGGPDLVQAFRIVLRDHPDARLRIVGCTPLGLPDLPGIEVIGRVPTDRLAECYRTATVYCMPTLREPFGVVFIEALSFGLPLLATNIGAIPDFVTPGRNGHLVEPRNVAQIAAALSALLASPETCAAFGERSLSLARDRYNWPAVAARMSARVGSEVGLPARI